MKLSVIIPAYNEEKNIKSGVLSDVWNYLIKQQYLWEVIIVDDGSTDRTAKLIGDFVRTHKGFLLLRIEHGGKAAAIINGFKKGNGDVFLFTDFDQSVSLSEVKKILPLLRPKGKYDVVIGSRMSRKDAPISRKLTGYGFILLRKLLLGLAYHDTQCGFKVFTKEAALAIVKNMSLFSKNKKYKGYAPNAGFDLELLIVAARLGLKVGETRVEWRHRDMNKFSTLKVSFLALKDILSVRRILNNHSNFYSEKIFG